MSRPLLFSLLAVLFSPLCPGNPAAATTLNANEALQVDFIITDADLNFSLGTGIPNFLYLGITSTTDPIPGFTADLFDGPSFLASGEEQYDIRFYWQSPEGAFPFGPIISFDSILDKTIDGRILLSNPTDGPVDLGFQFLNLGRIEGGTETRTVQNTTVSVVSVGIPEPSTLILLLLGTAGLFASARRRRR